MAPMYKPQIRVVHTDSDQMAATPLSDSQLYKRRAWATVVIRIRHVESNRKAMYNFSFQKRTCSCVLFIQHTTGGRYNG